MCQVANQWPLQPIRPVLGWTPRMLQSPIQDVAPSPDELLDEEVELPLCPIDHPELGQQAYARFEQEMLINQALSWVSQKQPNARVRLKQRGVHALTALISSDI
jgi:hypothetical protein